MKTLLLTLTLALAANAECNKQFGYAGVGINNGGGQKVSGVAAWARNVACLGQTAEAGSGTGIYLVSAVNFTGALTSPAYTVSQGAAIELPIVPGELKRYVNLMVLGDVGLAQSVVASGAAPGVDSLTKLAGAGGGLLMLNVLPAKWKASVVVAARYATGTANFTLTTGIAKAF